MALSIQEFGIDGLVIRKKTGCKQAHNRTSSELEQLVINLADKYWNDGVITIHDHLQYENNTRQSKTTQ